MKETLQIHHIAKRLPYRLKVQTPYGIKELKGIDTINEIIGLLYWIDNKQSMSFSIDCKPILFPLSCLTEPITVKEETFIPLVELAKKHFSHIYRKDYQPIAINEVMVYDEVIHRRFKFESGTFSSTGFDDFMSPVYNQFELFEKLIEWHFDLPHENLIEKGLAISVLDLDKNPYA